jgi:hypothetical protein
MNCGRKLPWFAMALLTAVVAAMLTAPSIRSTPASFCVGWIETGEQSCFGSEPELIAFQEAKAAVPLITFFRAKQAGGYKNFASAYGVTTCTHLRASGKADASDGDLINDVYSNGYTLDNSISSFKFRPGSNCYMHYYFDKNFQGGGSDVDRDCYDCLLDHNDKISSFKLWKLAR